MPLRLPLALILVLTMVGCRVDEPEPGSEPGFLVSADWLAERLQDPDLVVLYVGSDSATYARGHLPGARFLPLSAIAINRGDQLNVLPPASEVEQSFERAGVSDDSHVILYGDRGGLSAARAFFALDVLGHDRMALLDGGLDAWTRGGGTLSTEPPVPGSGDLTPSVNERLVVDAATVNEVRTQSEALLVDARPPAQHTGADPGDGIQRPGHIPSSVNLFWQDDLEPDGTLRSAEVLAQQYGNAGVSAERDLIAYCRTGMQASFSYFVMRHLGLQPRMYDGSFHDWSNNTNYPVESEI